MGEHMMLQETTWDTGSGQRVQVQEATPANDVAQPAPAQEPEIDVDAWFAQREPMIEALKVRRETLLSEVQEIERRLKVLGEPGFTRLVWGQEEEAPASPAPRKQPRPRKPAKAKGNPYLDGVRRTAKAKAAAAPAPSGKPDRAAEVAKVMSRTPEKVAAIGKRLGWGYATTWRSLEEAQKRGLVKSSGVKGRDMRWAVA
jgi:hypothetical protein